jgi:hypothetical protein
LRRVTAPELPDDVALSFLPLLGDEGGVHLLRRREIDEVHPGLANDLAQEIPDHAKVRKEQPIAEIVLSQENLSSREAYQQSGLSQTGVGEISRQMKA